MYEIIKMKKKKRICEKGFFSIWVSEFHSEILNID